MQHAKRLILLDPRELSHITKTTDPVQYSKEQQAVVQHQLKDSMKSILARPDIYIHAAALQPNSTSFLTNGEAERKRALENNSLKEPPPVIGHEESSTADDDIDGNYTKDSQS